MRRRGKRLRAFLEDELEPNPWGAQEFDSSEVWTTNGTGWIGSNRRRR